MTFSTLGRRVGVGQFAVSYTEAHMQTSGIGATLLAAALIATSGTGLAQQRRVDQGKLEYESNCANCHGVKGKGDGPVSHLLSKKATDLTTLAKKNGGVFPINHVYEVIDGRAELQAHGPRDMPIWGRDYLFTAEEDIREPEYYVRFKTLAVIDYVYRLQVK